jgi:hypothetical protein
MQRPLLVSVFIVASCGLAYELIAAAMASYLLGDSVTQFSTVIGAYLFAMGIGSWLSKHVGGNLLVRFIQIELLVGLLGGLSAGPAVPVVHAARRALPLHALRPGAADRDTRRAGDPADHAHPQARSGLQGPRGAGAFLRLHRRAGRVAAVPAAAGAAPRPGQERAAVRPVECPGRRLGAVAVPRPTRHPAGAARAMRGGDRRARRRLRFRRHLRQPGRGQPLQRGHHPRRIQPLPAHRRHALARRDAALPQPQPAVFLARRIPLPRGAGASRAGHPARRAQGAGTGRRRRHGAARNPQVPASGKHHAGRPRSAHDGTVFANRRCCASSTRMRWPRPN